MRLMRLTCAGAATGGDPILVNPLTICTAYRRDGKSWIDTSGTAEVTVLENLNALAFEFNAAMNDPLPTRTDAAP